MTTCSLNLSSDKICNYLSNFETFWTHSYGGVRCEVKMQWFANFSSNHNYRLSSAASPLVILPSGNIPLLSFGGAQYYCKPQICEFSSVRHASLALLVNIAEYHSLGRWIEYRVQYHPSMRVLTWKSATACSKTWTLDLVGARAMSYQLSYSNLTHHVTCRSGSYMKVCPRLVS